MSTQAIEQAKEALKPFAEAYATWNGGGAPQHFASSVCPADFRRASAAFSALAAVSSEAQEPQPRKFVRYGECQCILSQYCDGCCNPIFEDASPAPDVSSEAQPIDMILYCPNPSCRKQHIDKPDLPDPCDERDPAWTNPPHRSHKCHGCGLIWRPADVPTNGVAAIKTKGKNDSPAPDVRPSVPVSDERKLIVDLVRLWDAGLTKRISDDDYSEEMARIESDMRALLASQLPAPSDQPELDYIAWDTSGKLVSAGLIVNGERVTMVPKVVQEPVTAQPQEPTERDKLLTIIANAYQIVGAHDVPAHILDVLSDPEGATCEQVEAMLPYSIEVVAAQPQEVVRNALIWYRDEAKAITSNLKQKRTNAVTASMEVLALDDGARADAAISALVAQPVQDKAQTPKEADAIFSPMNACHYRHICRTVVAKMDRLELAAPSHPQEPKGQARELPKPDIRIDAFGDILPTDGRKFVMGDFYSAEQMRAALAQAAPVVPDGWEKALHAAVSALYFDDSSDFKAALGSVVRYLDADLASELLCTPKAAYDKVSAMLAAAPSAQAVPLTRQQIAQGFKSYPQYAYGAFEDGVRFAEKSHCIAVASAPAVPDGLHALLDEIAGFQELNEHNYSHADVAEINNWGVMVCERAAELRKAIAAAPSAPVPEKK